MISPGKIISRIYWCSQSYIERELGKYGIGIGEIAIIMALSRKSMSQKEIADRIHVDKTTISRQVKNLMKNGYVSIERDEKDGRRRIISLTEEGNKILPKIKEILREWRKILFHGFSPQEKIFLLRALERMERNAIKAMEGVK